MDRLYKDYDTFLYKNILTKMTSIDFKIVKLLLLHV